MQELRERTAALLARWRDAGGSAGVSAPDLERVFAASEFVSEAAIREPALLADLSASAELARARRAGEIRQATLALLEPGDDESAFMDRLRRLRRREMVRIAWRDLTDAAPLAEILGELSDLADAAIATALAFAERALEPRYGRPRSADGEVQPLVVLGMGKLGGRELNFSSDIDLVFLYPEAGETDGQRPLENEDYFTRLGQALIRLLDARTAEGFVFRVDLRLRPFGESGPPVVNFGAFEEYLQKHGRDWERYAYVKARAITGATAYGELYAEAVRPFVYRRYLDFGVYESLRAMKDMIAREVTRRDLQDDIKLGPGGIREIEFIAQAQQLIRGGSEPGLQTTSLLAVLPRLQGAKLLPATTVAGLLDAYEFLRRIENRLQMVADQQTHALPADELGRCRLAAAMGFAGWEEFATRLDAKRHAVTAHFNAVLFGPGGRGAASPAAGLEPLWVAEPSAEMVEREVSRLGIHDAASVARMLVELRQSAYFRRLDEFGRRRLAMLLPRLLAEVAGGAAGEPAAGQPVIARLLRIVEAIGGRTAYLALLNENASALSRLVFVCRLGDYLARQVAAHPLLLDELLDSRIFETLPDRAGFRGELAARLEHAGDDEERQVDALRHFRRAATFRIAMLDLTGRLPLMQVSDRLTDVAELILEQALALAWRQMVASYGEPRCTDAGGVRTAGVAIAGYGKLGGMELGYGSDLDLVFLHDSAGEQQQTAGPRVVDNEVFFLRLAQRLVHLLTVHTPAGRLYEVDVRLRPSGKGGLAFTQIHAFEEYQRHEAWTWEHQALLHSRCVAGAERLCAEFTRIRRDVLMAAVRRETLRADIVAMRERMRAEHARAREGLFDLKQDRGGIADIEFIAQYWVLRWTREFPPLCEFADTIRHLESLGSAALVEHGTIDCLVDAYRRYREAAHHLSLEQQPPVVEQGPFAETRARVAAIWAEVMVAGGDLAPV
ncbi:MAG TPA: bifunctional [glutamate--ammonia ligase]-adenylyl-L-tyrosine phosphorylase/[glutamate--ammonia-ligase] adenylyltransferase [Steroidobacteraceae bacterium]|nr:bifunctional [glutamate--ammonia ligase]-adenylyl-L-tyrosine phosphorylase/[glutamate--ammonia-ligase] adenylyltransferase [Steroidobacteraceae bacterium]